MAAAAAAAAAPLPWEGVAWGLGAVVLFGSFGVPIKAPAVAAARLDPVLFQGYKSFACALCSGLAYLALPQPVRFTGFGVLGAAVWVVNGVAAIMAVQQAGLGLSQMLWSGLSIFVSFLWGVLVFREPVARLPLAALGLCTMLASMLAMTAAVAGADALPVPGWLRARAVGRRKKDMDPEGGPDPEATPLLAEGRGGGGDPKKQAGARAQFRAGLGLALYVGVANGSFMAPLKYANNGPDAVKGTEYLVSFGLGAALVTAAVIGAYFLGLRLRGRPRPRWHARTAGPAALAKGLLWTGGNVCSIFAVEQLGLAVGCAPPLPVVPSRSRLTGTRPGTRSRSADSRSSSASWW